MPAGQLQRRRTLARASEASVRPPRFPHHMGRNVGRSGLFPFGSADWDSGNFKGQLSVSALLPLFGHSRQCGPIPKADVEVGAT